MRFPRLLTVAALAAVLAVPFAASAQVAPSAPQNGAPGAHAGHHRSPYMHALRSLSLSPDQKAQIKSISQQSREANKNADPSTRKANREKLEGQINGILTPQQRQALRDTIARERQAPPSR
jgi:Spy/CpxP family protein refolding chaperone